MDAKGERTWVFDIPAVYQICVHGCVPDDWIDRLQGMTMEVVILSDALTVTILSGELRDQAALVGVLNALYNLHVTLLLINRAEDAYHKVLSDMGVLPQA